LLLLARPGKQLLQTLTFLLLFLPHHHFAAVDMEERLWTATHNAKVSEVEEILKNNPTLNVNWRNESWFAYTGLHLACARGHDAIAANLLAHPAINVNQKDNDGCTPFTRACINGRISCARLLLKDSRVMVNQASLEGYTPLWYAAVYGRHEIIETWVASGREMDLGKPRDPRTDAIGEAKRLRRTQMTTLLERFQENPGDTRRMVRLELGWYDETAVGIFAAVVFVSDGLLAITTRGGKRQQTPPQRFFWIASQLPLELQMVLCYRLVGSAKEVIAGKDSEVAFRNLGRVLQ